MGKGEKRVGKGGGRGRRREVGGGRKGEEKRVSWSGKKKGWVGVGRVEPCKCSIDDILTHGIMW